MGSAPLKKLGSHSTLYRAKAYIIEKLGRPNLSMDEVALAANVSLRSLYKIAALEDISLTAWMWEKRLERSHTVLGDPACHIMTIGQVAFHCGFADQAHFSRRFKAHFGYTPAERRRMQILLRRQ